MASWQWGIVIAYGIVVLAAWLRHVALSIALPKVPFLTPTTYSGELEQWPLVSIMVPACNEEAVIETCVRALLEQDYPNYELLVVDDRSKDNTAAIVQRLAEETGRVQLLRITELPPGWTGKTHALHKLQQQAKGDWFLFVDADTRLNPSCVRTVVMDAAKHKVGMISLMPALEMKTFWEKAVQPFAGMCLIFLYPLSKANNPKETEAGFANGQFIFVDRPTYEAMGGHVSVRDKFVEDIHLGRLARKSGRGLRVASAPLLLSVRMYTTLDAIIRGWSRIFYSAVDFHASKMILLLVFILVFSVTSYATIALFGGLWLIGKTCVFSKTMLGLGLLHELGQTTVMARLYRHSKSPLRYLVYRIFGVMVMIVICLRTIRMCQTHQVTWRGTTYGKEIQQSGS